MDRIRECVLQHGPVASFFVALISLAWTSSLYPSAPQNAATLTFYDPYTLQSSIPAIRFHQHPSTNRTIWETVDTTDLHAGLERVEPGAWMPPHAHDTEEIILFFKGIAMAYDGNGRKTKIYPGTMIHVKKGARHAFQNVGEEPLWLLWSFPGRASSKFHFQQHYAKG